MIKRYSFGRENIGDKYEAEHEDKSGEWVRWKDVADVLAHLEDTLDELCDHAEKTKDLAWTLQVQVSREDNS